MPGFLQYIDFIFVPFRTIYNKVLGVRSFKGNIMVDINRSKALVARGKNAVGSANAKMNQYAGAPQQQQQQGAPPPQQYQQQPYPQQQYQQQQPPPAQYQQAQ